MVMRNCPAATSATDIKFSADDTISAPLTCAYVRQARRIGRLKNGVPKANCGGQRTHFRLEFSKLRV
jgi:hypothetical protein